MKNLNTIAQLYINYVKLCKFYFSLIVKHYEYRKIVAKFLKNYINTIKEFIKL